MIPQKTARRRETRNLHARVHSTATPTDSGGGPPRPHTHALVTPVFSQIDRSAAARAAVCNVYGAGAPLAACNPAQRVAAPRPAAAVAASRHPPPRRQPGTRADWAEAWPAGCNGVCRGGRPALCCLSGVGAHWPFSRCGTHVHTFWCVDPPTRGRRGRYSADLVVHQSWGHR